MIEFSVKGVDPRPQPRPRFAKGRCYEARDITKYKLLIRNAAQQAMRGQNLLEGNVKIEVKFRRKYKVASRRFGDLDNLFKAVADAINGVVYKDDAQIVKVTASKIQSENIGLDVLIVPAS